MTGKYYQMAVDGRARSAEVLVYGDITSLPWFDSDVSAHGLATEIAALADVDEITVRINSYGGEVSEGIAIYNALRAHPAHVTTVCDGFACSIASVVFMAGETRVMNEASLLMIHNAWVATQGNADELRRAADDLDTITEMSKRVYRAATNLSEEELSAWMDAETFIDAETAVARGFATEVESLSEPMRAAASARELVRGMCLEMQGIRSTRAKMAALADELKAEAVARAVDDVDEIEAACADAGIGEPEGDDGLPCAEDAEGQAAVLDGDEDGDMQAGAEAELACRMAEAYLALAGEF